MPEEHLKINTPHFAAKKHVNINEKDQPNRLTDEKIRHPALNALSANGSKNDVSETKNAEDKARVRANSGNAQ